jgi:hypothetical protein
VTVGAFGTTAGTFAEGSDSRIEGALQKSGGTMTGAIAAPVFDFPIEPSANNTANGSQTNDIVAGESITQWDLVYLKSDGKWWKADPNAEATTAGLLALALESKSANAAMNVALPGSICRNDAWTWATIGAKLYADIELAGRMTDTAGAYTIGDVARILGYVLSDDCIFFSPDPTYIEIA